MWLGLLVRLMYRLLLLLLRLAFGRLACFGIDVHGCGCGTLVFSLFRWRPLKRTANFIFTVANNTFMYSLIQIGHFIAANDII